MFLTLVSIDVFQTVDITILLADVKFLIYSHYVPWPSDHGYLLFVLNLLAPVKVTYCYFEKIIVKNISVIDRK